MNVYTIGISFLLFGCFANGTFASQKLTAFFPSYNELMKARSNRLRTLEKVTSESVSRKRQKVERRETEKETVRRFSVRQSAAMHRAACNLYQLLSTDSKGVSGAVEGKNSFYDVLAHIQDRVPVQVEKSKKNTIFGCQERAIHRAGVNFLHAFLPATLLDVKEASVVTVLHKVDKAIGNFQSAKDCTDTLNSAISSGIVVHSQIIEKKKGI